MLLVLFGGLAGQKSGGTLRFVPVVCDKLHRQRRPH